MYGRGNVMKYYVFITGALSISRNLMGYTTNPFMIRRYVEFIIQNTYMSDNENPNMYINEYEFSNEEELIEEINKNLMNLGIFIDKSNSLYQINSIIDDDYIVVNDCIHDEFISTWFSRREMQKFVSRLYPISSPEMISLYNNYFRKSPIINEVSSIMSSILILIPELKDVIHNREVECFDYVDECRMLKEYLKSSILFSSSLPFA